ncbi:hypothetical protein GCM10020255_075580 [Rhodococcus baikonurensis]
MLTEPTAPASAVLTVVRQTRRVADATAATKRADEQRQAIDADPAVVDAVCACVATVLELSDVDPGDNFFTLGGHSLTAMRLVGSLRKLGIRVVVSDVFDTPTPSVLPRPPASIRRSSRRIRSLSLIDLQ